MMNFKGSKMTKVVSGFVGLAMVLGPSVASAQTIAELQAQVAALMAQLAALTGTSAPSTTSCAYVFTKTLKQGVTDAEVMNLQKVLNNDASTQVAASGVGSKGNETSYFGGMTKAAVVKFQEKYASEILAPNGLTAGTGLVGAATRAKLNAMCSSMGTGTGTGTGTGSTVTGAGVNAMLDVTSPSSSSIIKATGVKVAVFKLSNSSSAAAKVTSVKLKRTGVSSDSTLRNVYLYNGNVRATDAASVASGNINFTDNSGLMTIPAMSSILLGVMIEVDPSAGTGETVGVMLTDVTTDAGAVTGLPVSGAQHQVVAAPSGMSTVNFGATTNPSASGNVDPQTDYRVWENTIQVGSRDALLSMIRFRQTGSVAQGDLQNFRLYVDGVMVGSAVEKVGSDNYVAFDFSASPLVLKSGGRTVKVLADIVGGSNKTFGFSIQQSVDAMFWDSQLMVVLASTVNNLPFSAVQASSQTVNQGTLTITKTTDSPSGNVVLQGSGLTLAKFELKAQGEKLKIENLRVSFTHSNGGTTAASQVGKVRNGALFANGVQIGSTQDINEDSLGTPYTQYNLGSSLIVEPGKPVMLEVRGDVFDNDGTNNMAGNDTMTVNIAGGSSNVYKMSSYGYFNNGTASGNQVTVASGTLTLSKFTAMANQTVTVPQTAYKVGEFRVTTGSTEAINLSQFTLDFTGTAPVDLLQDVYIVYGSKTSVVKSSVASTSNTFSINEVLSVNGNMDVKVYATLNANIVSGKTVITSLTLNGTSQASGNAVTGGATTGQTVTTGTGSLTTAIDASTPVAALVVGGSQPKVGSFKFTASNDAFTVTELWFNATGSAAIAELILKDGNTELKRQAFNATDLKMTGLTVPVGYNTNKVLDVYAVVSSIGTGNTAAGTDIAVSIYAMKHRNSNGVETTVAGLSLPSSSMYAYKTKPTIAPVALPTSVLAAGSNVTVGKVAVTSDAGGAISWRKLSFNYTKSGAYSINTFALYDAANESTALTGVTCTDTASTVACVSAAVDQQVSGTKTYVLKANVTGTVSTGESLSVRVPTGVSSFSAPTDYASVAAGSTFTWSDESVIPHTGASADWNDNYLVKNIPTDGQTLTK